MIFKVGIFDSGVGGLTVAKSIYQAKLFDGIELDDTAEFVARLNRIMSKAL